MPQGYHHHKFNYCNWISKILFQSFFNKPKMQKKTVFKRRYFLTGNPIPRKNSSEILHGSRNFSKIPNVALIPRYFKKFWIPEILPKTRNFQKSLGYKSQNLKIPNSRNENPVSQKIWNKGVPKNPWYLVRNQKFSYNERVKNSYKGKFRDKIRLKNNVKFKIRFELYHMTLI